MKKPKQEQVAVGIPSAIELAREAAKDRPLVSYYGAEHDVLTVAKGDHGGEIDMDLSEDLTNTHRTGVDYSAKRERKWTAVGKRYTSEGFTYLCLKYN